MISPETLNTKVAVNIFIFLLVNHMVDFDARFDSYEVLNSEQGVEHFLDILTNDQVLRS
jgi:hypothetical protein